MKSYLLVAVAAFAVGVLLGGLLGGGGDGANSLEHQSEHQSIPFGPAAATHDAEETLVPAPQSERTPVSTATAGQEERVEDALALAQVTRERDELLDKIKKLQLDLLRLQWPAEETPYGLFLHSLDAEEITNPRERAWVQYALEDIPVFLFPGEAQWIVDLHRREGWKNLGMTSEEAIIRFLGPSRVLAEAGPQWVERQRDWYSEEEWLNLFGVPRPPPPPKVADAD